MIPERRAWDVVEEALRESARTPRELSAALGIPLTDVRRVLIALHDARRVRRYREGRVFRYEAVLRGAKE